MKKAKSVLSLLLAFLMLFNLTVLTSAEGEPTLSVTADVSEFNQGAAAAKVVYTVKLNPNGTNVAAFQFTLAAPEGMTLATNEAESENGDGYWLADLTYNNKYNKTAPFTIFEYAPSTGYFGASGGIAGRTLDSETKIMTITATVDTSVAKTYTLGVSEFICYAVGSASLGGATPTVATVTIKHVHSYTKVSAVAATCVANGNIEYYTCDCGKCFKLVDGSYTEISKDETVISKESGSHRLKKVDAVAPTDCSTDAVAEHYKCELCGKLFTDADGKNVTTLDALTTKASHLNVVAVAKQEATCTSNGMEAHYKCNACNKLFTDETAATETDEAALKIPAAHKLVETPAKDATCTEAGNSEYWHCSGCNKNFTDEDGQIPAENVTIDALGHTYGDWIAEKAATCTENGVKGHYECSVCKKNFDADKNELTDLTIKALGHKMTKTDAKAATCTEDGYGAYWTCSVCNKKFSDAKGENEIAAPTVVNKLGHEMTHHERVEATCQKTGMSEYYECSRCNGLFRENTVDAVPVTAESLVIEKVPHTPSDSYAYTTTEHWKFCTVCGEKLVKAAHDFTVDEATGTKTCTTCGYKEFTTEPGEGHTCTMPNGWSFDDNSHWHACGQCSKKSDEAKHSFDEWVTDVEATATSTGLRHRTCNECKYVQQEVIAKITTTPTTPSHRPGSGTGSATSSDKVQSSKTFDAGIATYVGLSILSLTGSALVIGKKKEF